MGSPRHLRRESHSASTPEMSVLQFPNGSANLTYLLTFDQGRFVLRRPPFGVLAPGAHDMRREFRVLSRLWTGYDRAPRAYVFCDDHDVIGSDFVVSEYRSGEVIWATLTPSMAALPDAGRRVGFATVDALADLHLVDPAHCGLADLGKPAGFLERQLAGWRKRWDLVATPEHDQVMDRGGRRARAHPAGVAGRGPSPQRFQGRQLPVRTGATRSCAPPCSTGTWRRLAIRSSISARCSTTGPIPPTRTRPRPSRPRHGGHRSAHRAPRSWNGTPSALPST